MSSNQLQGVVKVKGVRSSREAETRRAEERMAQLREGAHMNAGGPLDIPAAWIPDGWIYGWGRAATLGEPDNNRLSQLATHGWTPVPVDRHPQLMLVGVSFRNEYLNGYIHRGGLILFERPLEWDRMQTQKLHDYTNGLIAMMPGYEGFQSQHGIVTSQLMDPSGQPSLRRTLAVERPAW